MPADRTPTEGNQTLPKDVVDPTVQIKFTIIFGILALVPFVLFYYYGLESKSDRAAQNSTASNSIPTVKFQDVTDASRLHFTHVNGAAGEKLLPETMGGGCAFFDFDNDGHQDIVLINSTFWPWAQKDGQRP